MQDEILMTVQASSARRIFGVGTLMLLGGLLVYVALTQPPANLGWQAFLLILGVVVLVLAEKMRRATLQTIELTETQLRSSDGTVIAEVAQVMSIDRGTFAFKPSNGFMLRLTEKAPRTWCPGLWWRIGRRVGVGGVTSASETKSMAEIISVLMAQRDQPLEKSI